MTTQGLIIFDLDGTLIDSRQDLVSAINAMRADFKLKPLPFAEVVTYIGCGVRNLCTSALHDYSGDLDDAIVRLNQHYLEQCCNATQLYPHARAVLSLLRALRWKLGLITNKPKLMTQKILNHFTLTSLFDGVVAAESGFALKPDPAGVIHLCQLCKIDKNRTWLVGDHHTDVDCAQAAGIQLIFAKYGFGSLKDQSPQESIASLQELAERILFGEFAPHPQGCSCQCHA